MSGSESRLLPKELMQKVYDRHCRGETKSDLAEEFGVSYTTMVKYIRQFELGVVREWQ